MTNNVDKYLGPYKQLVQAHTSWGQYPLWVSGKPELNLEVGTRFGG